MALLQPINAKLVLLQNAFVAYNVTKVCQMIMILKKGLKNQQQIFFEKDAWPLFQSFRRLVTILFS